MYYGTAPSQSCWNGCSTGGRQALVEATRYPGDFDGIIAGAAANPKTYLDAWRMWMAQIAMKDRADRILQSQYPLIHKAVLAQCDAVDGLQDGLLEDPMKCRFDPRPIVCKALTISNGRAFDAKAGDRARAAGPARSQRKEIFPGYAPGSAWMGPAAGRPGSVSVPLDQYRYIVFNDPKGLANVRTERDLAAAEKAGAGTLSASARTSFRAARKEAADVARLGSGRASTGEHQPSAVQPERTDAVRLFMVPG
jgi:feruloyl esterase